MAGYQENILSASTPDRESERCVTFETAKEQGQRLFGVVPSPELLRAQHDGTIDPVKVNLRIADQPVMVHGTGCTTDQENWGERTRVVPVDCPADVAQRCGSCILGQEGGEDILTSLKNWSDMSVPRMQSTLS